MLLPPPSIRQGTSIRSSSLTISTASSNSIVAPAVSSSASSTIAKSSASSWNPAGRPTSGRGGFSPVGSASGSFTEVRPGVRPPDPIQPSVALHRNESPIMANTVAPQPEKVDNSSGSLRSPRTGRCNDWPRVGRFHDGTSQPDKAHHRCRTYDGKRSVSHYRIDLAWLGGGSPYTKG